MSFVFRVRLLKNNRSNHTKHNRPQPHRISLSHHYTDADSGKQNQQQDGDNGV